MQERVQKAIEELNYRPRTGARGLRGQTFTIAIGSEIPQRGNDFFTQVTSGAARKLAGSGYQLIIAPSLEGEQQHRAEATGERAIELLLERIEGTRTEPRHVRLDPTLAEPKSSAQI